MNTQQVEQLVLKQQSLGVVAIKNQRTNRSAKRLPLPVTIGSSSLCDVIINSNSVAEFARIIYGRPDGKLGLADPMSGVELPMSNLANYGIAVSGPYSLGNKSPIEAKFQDLLAAEAIWFAGLSTKIRSLSGGSLPQKNRLGVWGAGACILLAIGLRLGTGSPARQPDLSRQPLPITYASITPNGFGSVQSMRSYANGLTFIVEVPEGVNQLPHTFSFDAKELEADRELTILVNDKEVYSTKPDRDCLSSYCAHSALIPIGTLTKGTNSIFIQHKPVSSDYVVKNLILAQLTNPTGAENVAIQQSFALAKRAFEERGISHENIIAASREVTKLNELLNRRLGVEELQAETSVLSKNIQDELGRMRDELWFNAQKEKQLGNFKSAKTKFEGLLQLHPDNRTKERQLVQEQLDEIAELSK